ncbi:somatostatin receptor type 2-like protein [Dinothrombium tinctorium]|uniref:Somatostatin receptor type 2-like protein n=1 Tax=Dinothrombium tinctorium TaxID=1965070 RepID=A0A3S3NN58_9ACAR|nr:somatostatin receptor type 2-like protein [Dinothrombium tinctorium]RWS02781.1 somatostatin receptor type 2-like protein [Dinothrombium tinctorium]RWS02782.1 somatostatin receptor type 2-like protein [Dinothrombium tinctorium]
MQNAANMFILNLSIADLLFLARLPILVTQEITSHWPFGLLACKAYRSLMLSANTASCFLITLISFERYFAVCKPFKVTKLRDKKIASVCCLLIWIVSFLFRIPSLIYSKSISYTNHSTNETWTKCRTDWPKSIRLATFFVNVSIGYFIPCLIVIFLYVLIVIRLAIYERFNSTLSFHTAWSDNFKKVTKVSLTIITCYIICWTPYWIIKCVSVFMPKGADVFTSLNLTLKICLIFLFLQSAINPLLYIMLGFNFKVCLKLLFSRRNSVQTSSLQNRY